MRRLIKVLLVTLIIPAVSSCMKDDSDNLERLPDAPEGYVRSALELVVAGSKQVRTKATPSEEAGYNQDSMWVLVFNAASATDPTPTTIVQAPIRAEVINKKLYALLRATEQPVTIVVVTGLTKAMNQKLDTPADFIEGTTTYSQVNEIIKTTKIDAKGVPIGKGVYFPMSTELMLHEKGTKDIRSISGMLNRIVAKIDVDASGVNSDFTLQQVTLVNGAGQGLVMPLPPLIINNGGVVQYNEKSANGNKVESQIYVYENLCKDSPTKLLVKGEYRGGASTYYRMDLHKDNGDGTTTPYSIERHKQYLLNVTQVHGPGYSTPEEALRNPPYNTKYTVDVTDPTAGDMISNGQYYLGVSNSELVVYGAVGKVMAVTVTTNAPSTISTNSITANGGLTLHTTALTTPTGSVTTTNVEVSVHDGFVDTAKITIKVGNLTKVIPVIYKNNLPPGTHIIGDFKDAKYVSGKVESDGGNGWMRLSAKADGSNPTSPGNKNVNSPNGGIYMVLSQDTRTTGADFYILHPNKQGSVRVIAAGNSVKIDYLHWATGNLVADGNNACAIGAPTDGGLYFQYGSLIGWKGGATANGGIGRGKPDKGGGFWGGSNWSWESEAMIWPRNMDGFPSEWPKNQSANQWYSGAPEGFVGQGDLSSKGVGDPCRYYLGGTWSTPTVDELVSLIGLSTGGNWVGWDLPFNGRWVYEADVFQGISGPGTWFGGPLSSGTGIPDISTSIYFHASGLRNDMSGGFDYVNNGALYWSSSTADAMNAPDFWSQDIQISVPNISTRSYAFPVRCVNRSDPAK